MDHLMVRQRVRTLLIASFFLMTVVVTCAGQESVLLIIADDLGTDSLSGFNGTSGLSLPPTPTLDGLRSEGIAFQRCYAYPTCSPTRAAIMTGRHAFRTGVTSPTNNQLQPNDFTLPEALLASGQIGERLACIGKWHLGNDPDSPNEIGGWPYFSGSLRGGLPSYFNWMKVVDGISQTSTTYATTDNVNDAVAWIQSQGSEPWFLWLAFNAPHTPLHRPPLDLHDYDTLAESAATNSRDHYEAMVQAMDTEMARLLNAVDLAKTTLIFIGDNGTPGAVIQSPFSRTHAKDSIYEGGVRVPMIVAGSAVNASLRGSTYQGLLHICDLYSTILELFGADPAKVCPSEWVLDSRSFLPLLETGTHERHPGEIFCFRDNPNNAGAIDRAIVGNEYKYVLFADGSEAFFKVDDDPRELDNLLGTGLTALQISIFEESQARLGTYVNRPVLGRFSFSADYSVLEVGWHANAALQLEESPDLSDWTPVLGAEILEGDGSSISIRFPSTASSSRFFRVLEIGNP